jgi:Mrp family chromosome partitioning ATPase/uncharacterized protein involved in exopolysaccharide biosynthesis
MKESVTEARLRHLSGGKKRKPFHVMGFLLRRIPAALLLGTLVAIPMALVVLPRAHPVYETEGVLMIDPTKEPTITGRERDTIPGDFGDWTRTQISRMTSEDVLIEAIRRVPVEERPDFLRAEPDHPANPFRLMKRLRVYEVQRTYLVKLMIRNDSPEGLARILNSVMEVYLEKIENEFKQTYLERRAYLIDERKKISERLREEEKALLALAGTVENISFLHEGYNVHLGKVEQIQRLYWEAFAAAAEADAQLLKVEADRARIDAMSLQAFADARVADNFGINRIEQWTYEQLQQMRTTIDGLTAENPDRVYVEDRMDAMNQYLVEYKQRVNNETIKNLKEKQQYELETQEQLARSAAEAAGLARDVLSKKLEESREEASRISMAIFQASNPSFARTQLRDRLEALNDRIDDTEMAARATLRVQIDKPAGQPGRPSSTNTMMLLIMVVALSYGPPCAAMLVYEIVDIRLRTAREVTAALGGVGPDPITAFVSQVGKTAHYAEASVENPDDLAVKRVRDLAARLDHDRRRSGGRLYSIAGLGEGCGCTTTALNLGHVLRGLCGQVLLIELNPARPGLRAYLSALQSPGIESYLRGDSGEDEVRYHDGKRDVDVIFSDGSGYPFDWEKLGSFLDECIERYDMVLVDAGALPEELTAWMIRRSDGVVLVGRYKQSTYPELKQAADLTVQAGVPALTAVLIGTPEQQEPFLGRVLQRSVIQISTFMETKLNWVMRKGRS